MASRNGAPGSRLVPAVAALISRRHEALRTYAVAAHNGRSEGVHQARVASRRLREVVPVLGYGLDDLRLKPLRRDLRALTRALGPVRELDVASGMIAELVSGHADAERLRAIWLHQLEQQRRGPVRALTKALAPRCRARLDAELETFAAARAASSDEAWRESLGRRLAERADALRTRVARTGTLYRPEPLHEVRIATKKLRYVLEITAEAGLARLARPLRTLKMAQDSLGRLHDLDVLFTLLYAVPDAGPGQSLQHAAAAVVASIEQQSRRLHARYLRSRVSLVRVADLTLGEVVPRLLPPASPARSAVDGH